MDTNEQRSCKEPFNHELGAQGGGGGGGIWEKIDGGFGHDITVMSRWWAIRRSRFYGCCNAAAGEFIVLSISRMKLIQMDSNVMI